MISDEELIDSLEVFVKEHLRYPSKQECASSQLLFGYNTYLRRLGNHNQWGILEKVYELTPNKCGFCNESLLFNKRNNIYCSSSCAAKSNNKKRIFNFEKSCYCGNTISRGSSTYCSQQCHIDKVFEERCNLWIQTGLYQSNKMLSKYLTKLNGYSCSCCGISDWNNSPITLEVDHINGDNEDCSISNVRLVCPNCHSQTPTYKAKNKGKGRKARRLRYKKDKAEVA